MFENGGAKGTRESLAGFGKLVGGAFVVLGAIFIALAWKHPGSIRFLLGQLFIGVGGVLVLCGLFSPMILKPVEKAWWAMALAMGAVVSRVLLSALFYLVFLPIGLAMRLVGRDPLERAWKKDAPSYWTPRKPQPDIEKHCKRQF